MCCPAPSGVDGCGTTPSLGPVLSYSLPFRQAFVLHHDKPFTKKAAQTADDKGRVK
jgi:hypothetical protein